MADDRLLALLQLIQARESAPPPKPTIWQLDQPMPKVMPKVHPYMPRMDPQWKIHEDFNKRQRRRLPEREVDA